MKRELVSYLCADIKRLVERIVAMDNSEYDIVCLDVAEQDEPVSIYFSGYDDVIYLYVSMKFQRFDYVRLLNSAMDALSEYFTFNRLSLIPMILDMRDNFTRNLILDRITFDSFNKKYLFEDKAVTYREDLVLSVELTEEYIRQKEFIKDMLMRGTRTRINKNNIFDKIVKVFKLQRC